LRELNKSSKPYPEVVTVSGASVSQNLVQNTERLANNIWYSGNIDQSLSTVGTSSEALSGIAFSAVTYSPYSSNPPQPYFALKRVLEQRSQQEKTAERLGWIDQSLKDEYLNVWRGLHTAQDDKERAPMFLIREVIRRLFEHYAPDEKVMEMFDEDELKKGIHKSHRIKYIADAINPWRKQTFLDQEKAFNDIYGKLSKAHKDGRLNESETRSILYQADGLIRLLLDSFN
ncbi:MAG: hypothetical protein PHX72_00195, partial [Candidatus Shapirobacteria bacterium]|nr:hypothetical protein [Candidatus Shapirobacteria bacterium]